MKDLRERQKNKKKRKYKKIEVISHYLTCKINVFKPVQVI